MRRTATFTVTTEGRDKGKSFLITEQPADIAERWATRAFIQLANAGAKLPEGVLDDGMSGLAATLPGLIVQGVRSLAGLTYNSEVETLLAEMMTCVQFVPPGAGIPPQPLFSGSASQLEEIGTRLQLRMEVVKLHLNPSLAAVL